MPKKLKVTLGDHFADFIDGRIRLGRYKSISEVFCAGLRLLEQQETKLDILRNTLAKGEQQLEQGKGIDGDQFMKDMMS